MIKSLFRKALFGLTVIFIILSLSACQKQPGNDQSAEIKNAVAEADSVSVNGIKENAKSAIAQYQGSVPLPQDIAKIKKRGKLLVAMYRDDRPPFFYKDKTGQLTGIDVSLADDIARWLGVKTEFVRSADSFDGVVDQVANGDADIAISKLSVTLNRAQRVSFTQPYVVFQQALLVNRLKMAALERQHPGENPLELIINTSEKIAVRTATSYVDYARQIFMNAEIVQIDEMDGIMQAANKGEVLAAFYDDNELRSYLHSHPDAAINLQLFVLADRRDPIAIAVGPEERHLLQWLNLYLEQMKGNLQINQIIEKYQGGQ